MRRLLPLLGMAFALSCAAALTGSARGDDVRSTTVHGRITAMTTDSVTVRGDGGASLTCGFHRGQSDVTQLLLQHAAVGQAATLICFSGDGGATWDFSRLYADPGTKVSVAGPVTRITPSSVEVTPDKGQWLTCHYDHRLAAKIVPLGVGQRVKLTCSLGALVDVTPAGSKRLTTLTITGSFFDMTPAEGLMVFRQDPAAHTFVFTVPDDDLASVEALSLSYGDPVSVTARASGKRWILASVTRD